MGGQRGSGPAGQTGGGGGVFFGGLVLGWRVVVVGGTFGGLRGGLHPALNGKSHVFSSVFQCRFAGHVLQWATPLLHLKNR